MIERKLAPCPFVVVLQTAFLIMTPPPSPFGWKMSLTR